MTSAVPVTKANAGLCLSLLDKLSEERNANVFFSPFSVSTSLVMLMMGAGGDTASQISEVLGLTETDRLKSSSTPFQSLLQTRSQTQMKMRRQMNLQPRSRLPHYLSKVLKTDSDKEDSQSGEEDISTGKEDVEDSKNNVGKEEEERGEDAVQDQFAKLWRKICKDDANNSLFLVNKLYGDKTTQFLQNYIEKTKEVFDAELESVDFKDNAEQARTDINKWVQEQTKDKIKEVLTEGAVDDQSRLVLINAVYFKGKWNKQFYTNWTEDAEFRLNKTDKKSVKMMCLTSDFVTTSVPELDCEVLELPYEGDDLSMIIVLPNDIKDNTTGLEKLQKELSSEKLMEWASPAGSGQPLMSKKVNVKLPQFKMEELYDLNAVLTSMGMVDAFDPTKTNFSGMLSSEKLILSKMIQKACVVVNEEGTEAAAATVSMVECDSPSKKPEEFHIDHPFLFFICQKSTQTVLFAGRCCSPQ